jgi:hypothetical protein
MCACTGSGGGASGTNTASSTSYSINGLVQKGPFVQGTTITIQELDSTLAPTGTSFITQTTDSTGAFSIASNLTSPFVEIIASGYYYNEVAGALSDSTLTLRVYADLSVTPNVNVNVLTERAHDSAILQGSNTVAQLSEFLAQLGSDIGTNGAVTSTANAAALISNAGALNYSSIEANLASRYSWLG